MDVHLQQRQMIGRRDASRYIDDYTLSSPEGASGEELLAALRQSAAIFELELNSEKSAIYPTTHRQNIGWQQAARAHLPRPSPPNSRVETSELQHFLYQLGRVCVAHPDVNVEKFGLQHARSALVNADDWNTLKFSLINAYRRNSSLVSFLVEACLLRQAAHGDVRVEILTEFVNRIPVLARANRTGEIIWLLFMAIRLGLTLSAGRLTPLFSIENAFVALLVVCLAARGLVQGGVDHTLWDRSLTAEGFAALCGSMPTRPSPKGFFPGSMMALSSMNHTSPSCGPSACSSWTSRGAMPPSPRPFAACETTTSTRSACARQSKMRISTPLDDLDESEDDGELFEINDIYSVPGGQAVNSLAMVALTQSRCNSRLSGANEAASSRSSLARPYIF